MAKKTCEGKGCGTQQVLSDYAIPPNEASNSKLVALQILGQRSAPPEKRCDCGARMHLGEDGWYKCERCEVEEKA